MPTVVGSECGRISLGHGGRVFAFIHQIYRNNNTYESTVISTDNTSYVMWTCVTFSGTIYNLLFIGNNKHVLLDTLCYSKHGHIVRVKVSL